MGECIKIKEALVIKKNKCFVCIDVATTTDSGAC